MDCPTCGRPMKDVRGISEKLPHWVCNHTNCSSHHQGAKCPQCTRQPAQVDVRGIGAFEYTCDQGHLWRNF